jgi:hypothetical protein
VSWTYNWGSDSLILGENFVCAVPLEDQAATTNNLGLGSPFAGNPDVYPVYRMGRSVGQEDAGGYDVRPKQPTTLVRGVLFLPPSRSPSIASSILDISGRKVLDLLPGPNDIASLAPGVYFATTAARCAQGTLKVVVTR